MALSLEREPSLEVSEWGALGKAHAAGGDQRRAGVSPVSCPAIQARQGGQDASHDRARLRSEGTPFAAPLRPQSGTAILAMTATGHRLEACATFRHRRQMGDLPHRNTATSKRIKVSFSERHSAKIRAAAGAASVISKKFSAFSAAPRENNGAPLPTCKDCRPRKAPESRRRPGLLPGAGARPSGRSICGPCRSSCRFAPGRVGRAKPLAGGFHCRTGR